MNSPLKKKAPYNRTLSLSDAEISAFKKELIQIKQNINLPGIENKIINQDLFSVLDFLPNAFIDLLFIDPPYNLYKKFNSYAFKEMDSKSYEEWIDTWLSKMVRLLKPNASIYICCDWKSSSAIFNAASKYFIVQNRITWEREKGRGAKTNWKNCSEDIWFCTLSNNYTFNVEDVKMKRKVLAPYKNVNGAPKDWLEESNENYRITYPSNLWNDISIPFWSMPENTEHPTQKPEKLLAKIILASSNGNELVFDPFLGSGTTAVTAKKLNRKFCGVEMDETYCCYAIKRLYLADKEKSIQGYHDGVFWERNTLREQVKSQKSKVKNQKK